jgi:hypothetical protein
MDAVIVACVRTGGLYPFHYVTKLRNMVARHMRVPYTFYCLTDQPERCEGVSFIDVSRIGLPGWWAKCILFEPAWRGQSQVIYLDLDTVLIGDISQLADVPGEFAICDNFARLAGVAYPCKYNSSVMVIGAGRAAFIWHRFEKRIEYYITKHSRYGDQMVIEELYPQAAILQRLMPKGFFFNYRNLTMTKPKDAAVVNFGGSHKPHNCDIPWVKEAWA